MQGLKRRVIQAISYEIILLNLFIPIVTLVFKQPVMHRATLGMSLTILALLWNMIFNYGFEKWEVRQGWYTRGLKQRLLHALGFEGGLLILGVPVIAYFLEISLLEAIIADIGFTIVIMVQLWSTLLYFSGLLTDCLASRNAHLQSENHPINPHNFYIPAIGTASVYELGRFCGFNYLYSISIIVSGIECHEPCWRLC